MDLTRTPVSSTDSQITGTALGLSIFDGNLSGIFFSAMPETGSCALVPGSCEEPLVLTANRSATCAFTW